LLRDPRVQEARRYLEADDLRVLEDQREITEIPAPPFGEEARAARMAEMLAQAGLTSVETDAEGNVLARFEPAPRADRKGRGELIVSAHLDTVFPPDTDVSVLVKGDRLIGPGISDDGRGLAALVGLARVLSEVSLPLRTPLLFVATVGEEGAGDLRGVRHLFRQSGPGRAAQGFISLDGAGLTRIVTAGLGSRRFRMTVSGPGGHSWVNWGTPNPIHALGEAVSRWSSHPLPSDPIATLTVARWGGGTSINSIPQEAWVELELRCVSEDVLQTLESRVRRTLTDSIDTVNGSRAAGSEPLRARVETIGTRPAGETDGSTDLVRAATAATLALSATPELAVSSTDANIPMALGIPAITLGAGGEAGQAHTTDEWYRNVQGPEGILRALLTVLLLEDPE
jgi:acetylornithine deacetylase/succinyl-diaminopimelate desuccinylase-like protein